jgi:hypothetical protein
MVLEANFIEDAAGHSLGGVSDFDVFLIKSESVDGKFI